METDWKLSKLGDLVSCEDGKRVPLNKSQRVNIKGNYPYWGASGIVDYINKYAFDGEYLLISEDGENLSSRRKPISYIADGKFWVNNHIHVVKVNKGVNIRYLMYFVENMDLSQITQGSTRPKLNQKDLLAMQINTPPKKIQDIIVVKLDTFFKEFEVLKQEKGKAKDNHEEILQSAIMKLTSDKTELQKGWNDGELRQFVEIMYGDGLPKRTRKEGKIPVYGSNGIIGYHNTSLVKEKTIIIGRKGSVGELHLTEGECYPIDTTYYIKIRLGVQLDLEMLYYLLKGVDLKSLDKSTAIPGINRNDIYATRIRFPQGMVTQRKLLTEIRAILDFKQNIYAQQEIVERNISNLPQSVLSKAFRGELA